MSSKVRLLNRKYEIELEAADNAELKALIEMLEERRFAPWVATGAQTAAPAASTFAQPAGGSDNAAPLDMAETLPSSATAALDTFAGEEVVVPASGGPTVPITDPALRALTWSTKDNLYTLAAQLPPGPDGSNRAEEAALLLMMGYGSRGEEPVTGTRLSSSLRLSGIGVPRIDRLLEQARLAHQILAGGLGKGRRYRLTATGQDRARKAAAELLSHLTPGAPATPAGGA